MSSNNSNNSNNQINQNSQNIESALNVATPSPHSNPAKPLSAIRNFGASKLERSQSLRSNARPLGPFNGPRDQSSATTDVVLVI